MPKAMHKLDHKEAFLTLHKYSCEMTQYHDHICNIYRTEEEDNPQSLKLHG